MKRTIKFFDPKTHTGWKKKQSTETRRRNVISTTDKRLTMHDRYVQAGRKLNQLSNVSQDDRTAELSRRDALYFFRKAKKTK